MNIFKDFPTLKSFPKWIRSSACAVLWRYH